jgi:hypothetical protein
MRDIAIECENPSHLLAQIGAILGTAGVNIEGLCLIVHGAVALIHLAVEDAVPAEHALADAGIQITDVSEVYVLDKNTRSIAGKPGSFGGICRTLTENGVAINFGYPAENNRYIFGVSDISKVRALLG